MIHEVKTANAVGGKTARACESCLLKRARWFCASDDAFLCQACDASVHSANPLASRHVRVRLETASSGKVNEEDTVISSSPSWHQGFTRKARTPRRGKVTARRGKSPVVNHPLPLVPELAGEEELLLSAEENDEQHLCRVPVFHPFGLDEFCTDLGYGEEANLDGDFNLAEFLACDAADFDEFAADVESLSARKGIPSSEDDSPRGVDDLDVNTVKMEDEDEEDEEVQAVIASHFDPALDMEMNWNFEYDSPSSLAGKDEEEMKKEEITAAESFNNGATAAADSTLSVKKRMLLRLNYAAVVADWATRGCPWTDGIRPHLNLDEFMAVACNSDIGAWNRRNGGGMVGRSRGSNADEGGREARVMRYREKRRRRLFSKKIRYQVRKLNAEKRPRMKGRFVKRASILGGANSFHRLGNCHD